MIINTTSSRVGKIARCLYIALTATTFIAQSAEANTVPDESSTKTIVILGASYAKGWTKPTLPGYGNIINRGVGGEETGDMAARMNRDVVALKPDAVLIWGHVNNITRSPPERIDAAKKAAREHYLSMLREARAAGIKVILATEIPWTEQQGLLNELRGFIGRLRGRTSYAVRISGHVGEINTFLRELAQRERLQLLDFERAFSTDDGTRIAEYVAEDGSHISAAGYEALTAFTRTEMAKPH